MSQTLEILRRKLDYFRQQEAVTSDPAQRFTLVEQIKETETIIAEIEGAIVSQSSRPPRAFQAEISRILKYAPSDLIGRDEKLNILADAWDKVVRAGSPRPHILTFVALGGEGKTALVAKWVAMLAHQGWPGCGAAFAWSFYSQGTHDQAGASSDAFLKEALTFFGDERDKEFAASNAGAFEKGQRLAHLVGQRRSLLILDGAETLQYAPTSHTPGQLRDQGVAALVKGLAANSQGLCVVTTRYSLPDLKAFWQTTAPEVKLLGLPRDAGVDLLRMLGVKGSVLRNIPLNDDKEQVSELEKLVEDVKGHALTLTLLGTYLRDAHGGQIRKRDLVNLEEADIEEDQGHAFRVMDAYVKWFKSDGETGGRALAVLRCLGLFDRPATADCFAALLKSPGISGMTKALVGLSDTQLNVTLARLESAKLLTVNRDACGTLLSLDAHALLREYFSRERRNQHREAWYEAHKRLYEHLCASTPDKAEPTLEDLQPLYQAVTHGCNAGLQQEVCDRVYRDRILRGSRTGYSTQKLGAIGADLAATASFFDKPWSRVSPHVSPPAQAWLLSNTGFYLRASGRLTEAHRADADRNADGCRSGRLG